LAKALPQTPLRELPDPLAGSPTRGSYFLREGRGKGRIESTVQYNHKFALKKTKTDRQTVMQFNLAHKLKRTEMFKRK